MKTLVVLVVLAAILLPMGLARTVPVEPNSMVFQKRKGDFERVTYDSFAWWRWGDVVRVSYSPRVTVRFQARPDGVQGKVTRLARRVGNEITGGLVSRTPQLKEGCFTLTGDLSSVIVPGNHGANGDDYTPTLSRRLHDPVVNADKTVLTRVAKELGVNLSELTFTATSSSDGPQAGATFTLTGVNVAPVRLGWSFEFGQIGLVIVVLLMAIAVTYVCAKLGLIHILLPWMN